MQPEVFEKQMERLKTEYSFAYGKAKALVFWEKFRIESDSDFTAAITKLLFEHKGPAPTGAAIAAAVSMVKWHREQSLEIKRAEEKKKAVELSALKDTPVPQPEIEEREIAPNVRELLNTLYSKFGSPRQTEVEVNRAEKLRKQLEVVKDL